ncbi:hypothetical protein [Microcystis aeruginosa]|uniref:Uncharacterized protein n=1 Tax=Microcystis aeruginosa SPC777 TaxID=482300 RepID=S3JV22_MICAE|nr:hypothetical protein [Microcystis aeruginosa]EPF22790.1 hypothetical protein MAESPC_01464 [Microcystis aeruginosa SPC777]EPF23692.1 hypothetical protein MAESPC_01111 [Microcystis aeruginosa SPC777]
MRVKREKREKGLESSPEYADYPKTAEVEVAAAVAESWLIVQRSFLMAFPTRLWQ